MGISQIAQKPQPLGHFVGAMVAAELYRLACPVALADGRDWEALAAAASLTLEAGPDGAAIRADL